MIRHLLHAVSAIVAGAAVAALLHVSLPTPMNAGGSLGAKVEAAVISPKLVSATLGANVSALYVSVADEVTARVTGKRPKVGTLLLNQPVTVLRQDQQRWSELPKGTAVQIVSAKGNFVQVRYAKEVVTVPKSVLQTGASRLN